MSDFLLTGNTGLLGSAFRASLSPERVELLPRAVLATGDAEKMHQAIVSSGARVVINCAAFTDLEAAERDPAPDRWINANVPAGLASACARAGAVLVHFSSTGCYGDWKSGPYVEDDEVRPLTRHHRNKAEGEQFVRASGCRHLIIRTGWLYGGSPGQAKNFVWKRMLEASGHDSMTSDLAQRGCPTHVNDVVAQTLELIARDLQGTLNVTSQGSASRFEYVSEIVAAAGIRCTVVPGPAFKRLAPVSANETSLNGALQGLGIDHMPEWRTSLHAYVGSLLKTGNWAATFGEPPG